MMAVWRSVVTFLAALIDSPGWQCFVYLTKARVAFRVLGAFHTSQQGSQYINL